MEYDYQYRIRVSDLWQVRMYYAYASYLAVVNIVCIFASIVLIIAFWKESVPWVRLVMLVFLSMFTVIQPAFIYLDCRRQVKELEKQGGDGPGLDLRLTFNEEGLVIRTMGKYEKHPWKDIISFTVRPTLVIVYTGNNQGYILSNRVLGETRKAFIAFVREKRQALTA